MKKFERLGEAIAPDGTVLTLYRHDGAYSIRVQGVELMSTRRHESEDTLAERVCVPLRSMPGARVLIGGLGFGFTLAAALRSLAADARVVVAEVVPEVIEWNKNPDYPLAEEALRDERVELRQADIARVLGESPGAFDAIMLDVDNGADALTTSSNAHLYRKAGIEMTAAALRPAPHSRLAYWSANEDPVFLKSLRRAGLVVETTRVRSHATSGTWHTLFVARVGASSRAPLRKTS